MRAGFLYSLSLIAVLLSGCDNPEKEAPPATVAPTTIPGSEITIATARTLQPAFALPAVVEAIQTAEILPEVSATLLKNHFSAGDIVNEGDLLVELNDENYRSTLNAAKADLASAKANALQAESNWKRAQTLITDGYISQLDFDKAKANISVAQASVGKAQAQLEKAQLDITHTKIYAPFSGRISKPTYAIGDNVSPNGKPLFELVQLDPIYVATSVELSRYNTIVLLKAKLEQEGQDIPDFDVTLSLAGDIDYPEQGHFQNWSHESTESSGMITARAEFPNPDGLLLPGQNVTVKGKALQAITRIMIPQTHVRQDQQGHFVFMVNSNQVVERKNIEVGIRDGKDWAIKQGLTEGDRVISPGLQGIKPGLDVLISE
ncbi:efflux RND transporter periplasmic adaptor subunit [Aestuariicella sp. G3-2]|uniref:efflux RND transporter periplasmic adaptor subunit n=1 Tax=Pseudomaricurvus albidus TaxID=2842452 RepID=UPI001C0E472A|nr:efflux RND transporter periplasmic adaptor subunit [Aestuariicella albida]MBU3069418.1 efflux RND transporter periplasmic adaptor subunit [Aestuariicella albida]